MAGVDEVGCGALAGPVFAGAVILPLDSRLGNVRDSKLLSAEAREDLYPLIAKRAVAWAVASATVEEIADLNIRGASLLAMRRAVESLSIQPHYLLVDAWKIPNTTIPQTGTIKGDRLIKSIAAASIMAKVTRDRLMIEAAEQFPVYGFEIHKGYATEKHRAALKTYGPCSLHRLSYQMFKEGNSA